AVACLRDQLLHERTQLLRLGFRRLDRALLDQRGGQVTQEREPLLAGAAQSAPSFAVTHRSYSSWSSVALPAARLADVPPSVVRTPSPFSSQRIPKFKPSRSRRSAISCSVFFPKFLTCRIWLSV